MSMADDERWMEQALALAVRGQGAVEPNPMVGAVVVRDPLQGDVVGQGYHTRYGAAHAEVEAFRLAGPLARGATLYVTLEPCCHYGQTPPCTEAVIEAGVRRVVAALVDPNPLVCGKGLRRLREAGIEVQVGVLAERAARLNAPFIKLQTRQRPWVIAKWAMTLDGKIASRSGDSRWVSSAASRAEVHRLRGRVDAILVGRGTVEADDPLLTARPAGPRTAARVVVDSLARLRTSRRLIRTSADGPVLVATTAAAAADDLQRLRQAGAECVVLPTDGGRVDLGALLEDLGRRRWTNLLVEGGGTLMGALFDAGLVDEVVAYVACEKIVGGAAAPGPVAGHGVAGLAEAISLQQVTVRRVDADMCISGLTPSGAAVVDDAVRLTRSEAGA